MSYEPVSQIYLYTSLFLTYVTLVGIVHVAIALFWLGLVF